MVIKLNLGCDGRPIKDFVNIDIDGMEDVVLWDIRRPLPYPNNSIDFINISQCLEHLNIFEAVNVLRDCYRILKPNCKLRISVPNIDLLIQYKNNNELDKFENIQLPVFKQVKSQMLKFSLLALGNMSGTCTREHYEGHQLLLNFEAVKELLNYAGFTKIEQVDYDKILDDEAGLDHSLYVVATKT